MATIIKPPNEMPDLTGKRTVFLAGSIDMGEAVDWQARVGAALSELDDVVVLNPRRDAWDNSWEQSFDNPEFKEQVEWELRGLEVADFVACYLAPSTYSPITLLEFGLLARSGKLIVACPEGFWRKGNVDVTCRRYGVEQVPDLEALIAAVIERLA